MARCDTVVIGGGQAGLAMGWHLARRGKEFVILDAAERSGDAWRSRWDSLRLFTPARYDALPGMRFPAEPDHWPGKDEVADYLERYGYVFGLPIRCGEAARSVRRDGRGFVVESTRECYEADQVVIATGPFQKPSIPSFARMLPEQVTRLHSASYRNPGQLPGDGPVVVVGAGNSGVQIASELAETRPTWLAVGERLPTLPLTLGGSTIFRWLEGVGAMDVSVESWLGRKGSGRDVLIGASLRNAARTHGVRPAGRITAVDGDRLRTDDGQTIEAASIVWATGFSSDYGFVEAPVFDRMGRPRHRRGITEVPGLCFLGLPWQHTRGSALLGWVGRDAEYLASCVRR